MDIRPAGSSATGAFVEGFFWRILTSQSCIHFCTFANRHTGRLVENASDLAACLGELGFFPVYRVRCFDLDVFLCSTYL